MRLKFICCDVFARLAYSYAAVSDHIIDLELVPMLRHNEPSALRADLQERINRCANDRRYDKIILGYGLCGNSISGLTAPLPLVIPRMHDCCAMFMGSREKFTDVFGKNLSMRWSSCGYHERCHGMGRSDCCDGSEADSNYKTSLEYLRLAEEYGEDNAEYVWQTLNPPIETHEAVYIKIDGFEYGSCEEDFKRDVENGGKGLINAKGSSDWFKRLVNGPWDAENFLTVPPGSKVHPVYDLQEVIKSV
ncbi:MAG: DUF1638 domain-containing protein [Defluviitaleaceae bacterium]|nr:DUF1638 domain-containing protein [Defluviitaleaceae bacterium]